MPVTSYDGLTAFEISQGMQLVLLEGVVDQTMMENLDKMLKEFLDVAKSSVTIVAVPISPKPRIKFVKFSTVIGSLKYVKHDHLAQIIYTTGESSNFLVENLGKAVKMAFRVGPKLVEFSGEPALREELKKAGINQSDIDRLFFHLPEYLLSK